jgi:integrase
LKGIAHKPETLLKLFEEHNIEYEKRVDVDRCREALLSYRRTYRMLKEFVSIRYKTEDVALKLLKKGFIEEFELFLRLEKQYAPKTIVQHLVYLKKMTCRAVNRGTLLFDPFAMFHPEQPKSPFRHLKLEEMERIIKVHIDDRQLCHVRDMFVFSCFTGLAYVDVCNLVEKHIETGSDGQLWIRIRRQKTNVESHLKVPSIALEIIEKYRCERRGEKIFNMPDRSTICKYMRRLEALCDIKHITYHMARHNFATHVALSNGVPMTTLSRMMGHTSITTTQLYGEITKQKINRDMKQLMEKVTGKYTIYEPV